MRIILLLAALLFVQEAWAVDETGIAITKDLSVVGVISGGKGDGVKVGIAVIKNNTNGKTYTLSIGDRLPSHVDFFVEKVRRKTVIVTDGYDTFEIMAQENKGYDEPATEERIGKYIDYFQPRYKDMTINEYRDAREEKRYTRDSRELNIVAPDADSAVESRFNLEKGMYAPARNYKQPAVPDTYKKHYQKLSEEISRYEVDYNSQSDDEGDELVEQEEPVEEQDDAEEVEVNYPDDAEYFSEQADENGSEEDSY